MTLSQIRRGLIAVVFVLILVVSGMLGYVKYQAKAAAEQVKLVNITAFSDTEAAASACKKQLQAGGYQVSVKTEKHKFSRPAGFRLVLRMDPELISSFATTLKDKHFNVEYIENKTALEFKTKFNDKAKAEKKAKEIAAKSGIKLQVEDNFTQKTKNGWRLIVKEAPNQAQEAIGEMLTANKFQDVDIEEIVDEPDASAPAEAATSEKSAKE